MNDLPDKIQIEKFMSIFKREADRELIVGEYVTPIQKMAVEDYGSFFALAPESEYDIVASNLATKLKSYNSALDNRWYQMLKSNEIKEEIEKILKRAISFRKIILGVHKDYELMNEHDARYKQFIELFDLYIDDLQSFPISIEALRDCNVLPMSQFSKPAKKSKTILKNYIYGILDKYKIKGYTKKAKILIDKINELSD